MKFYVLKDRYIRTRGNLIILNVIFISLIIYSAIFFESVYDTITSLSILSVAILIVNLTSIHIIIMIASKVIFEELNVKCVFGSRVRRVMNYDEVKGYGIFWLGKSKLIFISRYVLSETQRNAEAFSLYRKTKDVIVLEYHSEVMDLLASKCPNCCVWR